MKKGMIHISIRAQLLCIYYNKQAFDYQLFIEGTNCGNSSNIIFTPEDKSGIIICKAVQRREGQQNERTIAV